MSNAKWRKFFTFVGNSDYNIIRSNWKFIDDDRIFEKIGLPEENDLLEERFSDGRWLPLEYKIIEYVSISKYCDSLHQDPKRPLPKVEQPISELNDYLQSKANFPLVLSETELKLQAYEI
ncbi:hypothetical protein [Marinobacter daepoensis]|uniref:hypothetical protein n=1 Tax=Marinobacter daepoensis TaxID=262077 RepID=UPI0004A309AD|nr:hypothetical protein [Marinobacter daepoensis]